MKILHDDIMCICGKRRSGKSYFMKWLLKQITKWIIWDTNHEYKQEDFPAATVCYKLLDIVKLYNQQKTRIIYQPMDKTEENFDLFCKTMFTMSNVVIVVEEIERYATSYNMPPNLKQHIDIGRHRGLGLFCTVRRTKRTNPDILFNADHILIFHQTRPEDKEYLADFVGETALKIGDLPEYSFIWYQDREGTAQIMNKIGGGEVTE